MPTVLGEPERWSWSWRRNAIISLKPDNYTCCVQEGEKKKDEQTHVVLYFHEEIKISLSEMIMSPLGGLIGHQSKL